MRSWTQLELAWELDRAGVKVPLIAQRVGKHRETVYRWLKGMRHDGLREFVREYENAKKRPRRRKVNPDIERRVLSIRRQHRDCCGEKIVYLVLPAQLFDEVKALADSRNATVVEVLRRFIKLGLLAAQIDGNPEAALLIREGDTEREIIFI